MEEYVRKDIAKAIIEKGFNDEKSCLFAYNDEQIINPEVVQKYGKLTDDGYYELTKDGGGDLEWDYVYIYKTFLLQRRNIIVKRNYVSAPSIYKVLNWLRTEKRIHVTPYKDFYGGFYSVRICDENLKYSENGEYNGVEPIYENEKVLMGYESFEEAANEGIEYVLKEMI